MGYHIYKSICIATKDEHLHVVIQTTKELDKYALAVQTKVRQWLVICCQESLANLLKQSSTT